MASEEEAIELDPYDAREDSVDEARPIRYWLRLILVALTIPFSLLFASIWLDLSKIPANLLSLGALDFGMVVDGAVVMVENIVRHLGHDRNGANPKSPRDSIREACHEVQRPVFYAISIIITAYVPIFTLQRVEGRLFQPMAWTVAFALLGALTFSMLIAPVLSSFFFRKGIREWHNPIMTALTTGYRRGLRLAIQFRWVTAGVYEMGNGQPVGQCSISNTLPCGLGGIDFAFAGLDRVSGRIQYNHDVRLRNQTADDAHQQ